MYLAWTNGDTLLCWCSTESSSRLAPKHLLIKNRIIVTLQKDSIKGNLWNVVKNFKDQGRKSLQTDSSTLPTWSPPFLTGLLQGHLSSSLSLLPFFMPPCFSLASSDTFQTPFFLLFNLSYHPLSQTTSFPFLSSIALHFFSSLPFFFSLWHTFTLFSLFPLASWELIRSQWQKKR